MARSRGLDAVIEFLDCVDEDVQDSFSTDEDEDAISPVEELCSMGLPSEANENEVQQTRRPRVHRGKGADCRIPCKCGRPRHIAKIVCEHCGYEKFKKGVDWNLMKHQAPKSPSLATKRLFQRIFQLHAAHARDVVVLIHCKDGQGEKFRMWGTPGQGNSFVQGDMGRAISDSWKCAFGVTSGVRKEDIVAATSSSSDEDVYTVEAVLKKRVTHSGESEYLIKWLGWADEYNSWEPEYNVIDKTLLTKFK